MTGFYMPFESLTEALLWRLKHEGYSFMVMQRFSWPGLQQTGFMATPYKAEAEAAVHTGALLPKEGKRLNMADDLEKIIRLINDRRHLFFLNTFRERGWKKKMLESYKNKIVGFVRSRTGFKRSDGLDVSFAFKHGRLMAELQSGSNKIEIPAYELLK